MEQYGGDVKSNENFTLFFLHLSNILGSIFVLIVMGMNPFITTQGFAKISMMTTVIGAMIMDRDAIADVIDIVNADDFYQKQNGILFEAMTELYREGKPVDLVTLQNKLKKKVSTLQERGKALEIKFAKQCYKIYTGGKSNDYKKVSINYQSWLYPLELSLIHI